MSQSDQFRIDGHKLHLHPGRTADWLAGQNIAPIYMEVSPSGGCNHRCRFCGLDFLGYQDRLLPEDIWQKRLKELGRAGLRSIMYAGEGEPFLHPQMPSLAEATKKAGIDVAFTTNGVLLSPEKAAAVLPQTSWIKISCNAGTPETYSRVHGARPDDLAAVLLNLEEAAKIRAVQKYDCTLGVQMVLLPENSDEAVILAEAARDAGADYLVIKPYFVSYQSRKTAYLDLVYEGYEELAEELAACQRPGFKVIFRHQAMRRRQEGLKLYERCLALPFWGYVDSGGSLWGCLRHIGEDDFYYGNLLASSATEVLSGRQRREKMGRCAASLDIDRCHVDCRMEPVNIYLWELTHPGPHVNFI